MSTLSTSLIKDFVKNTYDKNESTSPSRFYGTAFVQSDGIYVQLDGSTIMTPVSMATDAKTGDRVLVEIVNHSARIIQNVNKSNSEIVADRIEKDETGVFQELRVGKEYVDTLVANDITAKSITADSAKITGLEAENVVINKKLTAAEADIQSLETEKLSAKDAEIKYANIDFSNIGKAAMEYFYSTSGLIKDVTIGDATIAGNLVGVTINGDLIEGNTVVAEKLVIKGEDGLYYKLNTDGMKTEAEQTDYNSLNGQVIRAKSVTAEKIAVEDLVAFGATIGGFSIGDTSIYSGVKESVDNTTRGIYMDNQGQIAFGDANNFVKFYKDTDGSYKLKISAEKLVFSATGKSVDTAIEEAQEAVSKAIISSIEQFCQSSSPTELTDNNWKIVQPVWTDGMYIWRRTKNTYGDGRIEYLPSETGVCITGNTGSKGEDSTLLRIESSRGTVFKNDTISTVLSVVIYHGTKRITDSATMKSVFGSSAYLQWKWQRSDDESFGVLSSSDSRFGDNGFTFTLSPEDVDTKVTFMCELMI